MSRSSSTWQAQQAEIAQPKTLSMLKGKLHLCLISQPTCSDPVHFCFSAHSNVRTMLRSIRAGHDGRNVRHAVPLLLKHLTDSLSSHSVATSAWLPGCAAHRADAAGDGGEGGGLGCGVPWPARIPSQTVRQAMHLGLVGHLPGCAAHRADAAGDGGEGGGLGRGVPGRLEHLLAAALAALQRAVVQQRAQDALHLPRPQLQPRHPLRRQHSDPG